MVQVEPHLGSMSPLGTGGKDAGLSFRPSSGTAGVSEAALPVRKVQLSRLAASLSACRLIRTRVAVSMCKWRVNVCVRARVDV